MDIGFEAFKQSRPALTPKRHEIAWGELDFTEQHVYRDHAFEALLQESSLNSIEEPGFKRFARQLIYSPHTGRVNSSIISRLDADWRSLSDKAKLSYSPPPPPPSTKISPTPPTPPVQSTPCIPTPVPTPPVSTTLTNEESLLLPAPKDLNATEVKQWLIDFLWDTHKDPLTTKGVR